MAELITGRLQPRVDLTPMVDLAFLLITFFMLTTQLNKQQAMALAMPDTTDTSAIMPYADNRTITVLLGDQGKIVWYWGLLDKPIEGPMVTSYGRYGIRTVLRDKIAKVRKQEGDAKKGLMVIIRPSNASNYGNLVEVLDEMAINNIKQYTLGNLGSEEQKILQAL